MELDTEVYGALGFGFLSGDDIDDAKGNLRLLRKAVSHEFGAFDYGNDNRDACALRDLQDAAVERQKLVREASFALRINHNGALVVLDQFGRVMDDADGLPCVVLYERHIAYAADYPAEDRKLQIFFFRDKCELVFPHCPRRYNRIEVGTVVTNQQEPSCGDFLVALVLNPHAAAKQRDTDLYDEQTAIEFAVLIIEFVRIHEQSEECRNHDKEKEQDGCEADDGSERN